MSKKLDKPIKNLLRKISKTMTSFSTTLPYIPEKMTGLGLKCLTGIIAQLLSTDAANIAAAGSSKHTGEDFKVARYSLVWKTHPTAGH